MYNTLANDIRIRGMLIVASAGGFMREMAEELKALGKEQMEIVKKMKEMKDRFDKAMNNPLEAERMLKEQQGAE